MKIIKIYENEELDSFGNYSNDVFLDQRLWMFISKVKSLSVKYNDPYFSDYFLSRCLEKMEEFLEKRGPRESDV